MILDLAYHYCLLIIFGLTFEIGYFDSRFGSCKLDIIIPKKKPQTTKTKQFMSVNFR